MHNLVRSYSVAGSSESRLTNRRSPQSYSRRILFGLWNGRTFQQHEGSARTTHQACSYSEKYLIQLEPFCLVPDCTMACMFHVIGDRVNQCDRRIAENTYACRVLGDAEAVWLICLLKITLHKEQTSQDHGGNPRISKRPLT
jgi:hypothetical protein